MDAAPDAPTDVDDTVEAVDAADAGPRPLPLTEQIEQADTLDTLTTKLADALPSWLTEGTGRELLSGRWLGHSLHPLLTDFPLGFWASASLLDLLGSERDAGASRRLIGFGLLTALPTAAAGLSDWSKLETTDRRTGLVHAQINTVALTLYGLSYLARRRGRRGVLLGVLGGLAATAGGYLGGHLSLTRAVTRDNRLLPSAQEP